MNADLRVLLIEDNPGDARLIDAALATETPRLFQVEHVSRLSEGCERMASGGFAAVLLDLGLPDSQGVATVRRAREAASTVPIVVLTGLGDESVAMAALAVGAQDYLVKGDLGDRAVSRTLRYAIERQQLDARLREAERIEAVRRLSGGIAHQFNNLLTAVVGYAELLRGSSSLSSADTQMVEEILAGANRAAELSRQLLAVSRAQLLTPRTFDLNAALRVMQTRIHEIAGPTLAVEFRYGDVDPIVFDADQLTRVIETLVVYACDEISAGGRLAFETAEARWNSHPEERFVQLTITDSGHGFDPFHPVSFDPFHNLSELAALRRSGLELPSVLGVMAQSGGHVETITSNGASRGFQLFFPVSKPVHERTS